MTDAAADQPYGPAARKQWLVQLFGGREFSPKQLAVARFIEGNVYAAETRTASEVAELAGVNVATVVRFAQALGFTGWPSFQAELQSQDLANRLPSEIAREHGHEADLSPVESVLRGDIRNLTNALETVDQAEVRAVAETIARSRQTVIVSAGSFAAVGQILAFNASLMGFPVTLVSQGGPELVVALAGLDERDCVVGISFWRLARQVVSALESVRSRGVPTIAMSDSVLSPFAKNAEHAIIVPTAGAAIFQSLTAAVSVSYAVLAALREIGGEQVEQRIQDVEDLYFDLGVLDK